ncbi:MAG: CRTAC1 family protein [Fimbriimonadaceae bacterium]|nr:CRTAC1 family protein [Fimbriimonadaceae bacterium]
MLTSILSVVWFQPPAFVDRTLALGLSLGADAACWVDVNNDGWVDLFAGGFVWRSKAGKTFAKGEAVGNVVGADFDSDGFVDLFSWSSLKLWRNEKGKSFVEFGLPALPKSVSRGACWGDFNRDGFVDLYVGGYEDWDAGITYPSIILMNEKGKRFKLAWTDDKYRTRGVTACDFDQDHDLDIYVSNYRLQPNQLWLNDGKGVFRDAAAEYGVVATSPGFDGGHSIGASWGDFNGDGYFDLFAGNFAHVDSRGDQPKSRFLRNLGPSRGFKFEDLGTCGVFYQESYASPSAGDFNNDGNLDLFFTTVYPVASFNKPNHPVLFQNMGGFRFEDVTKVSGLEKLGATYQAAWADFDNDGDLDLVTDGKLFVNQGNSHQWLEVHLMGDGKRLDRNAIGSQVRVKLKDRTLVRQVEAGTGEGNQNDLELHFGLGAERGPVTVEVTWVDGKVKRMRGVKTNRRLDIKYP